MAGDMPDLDLPSNLFSEAKVNVPDYSTLTTQNVPSMIVLDILEYLDLYTLMKCRLVCSEFRDLIDSSSSLQYKIELTLAGNEDGGYGELFARRGMLREHQERWAKLQWTEELELPGVSGIYSIYVCGSILVYFTAETTSILYCKQLPSRTRGIEERNWTVDIGVPPEYVGMDPGQDLLVIVESNPQTNGTDLKIHLLTLSMGEPHPSPSGNRVLTLENTGSQACTHVEVCRDVLGVLLGKYSDNTAVVLWNWKTGECLMHITSPTITSIGLLSETYLMLGIRNIRKLHLMVVDYISKPSKSRDLDDFEMTFTFAFPTFASQAFDLLARSTPIPSAKFSVPFYTTPYDRLCAFYIDVYDPFDEQAFCFVTSASSLIRLVETGIREFDWSTWGPKYCRILPTISYSEYWHTSSYGTRLVSTRRSRKYGACVDVYDFNQLSLKRHTQSPNDSEQRQDDSRDAAVGQPVYITGPTQLKVSGQSVMDFPVEVESGLGYRLTSYSIPGVADNTHLCAICTEDAIITVDHVQDILRIHTI